MKENLTDFLFPLSFRRFFLHINWDVVTEIRMRADRPVIIYESENERFITEAGNCTKHAEKGICFSQKQLEQIVSYLCGHSVYAYEDEIKQGYFSLEGGHRVGLTGQVILNQDQSIRTIRQINGINIRLRHVIKNVSAKLLPYLYHEGQIYSTLIISAPGVGKTTFLRDLIVQISNGNRFAEGKTVGVVDERSELAGCYMGMPQNDLGMRTDILDNCPKAQGIYILLRSMAPKVIAVDEISEAGDIKALLKAQGCGVSLIATAHGERPELFFANEKFAKLLNEQIFERFVFLTFSDGIRRHREAMVYDKKLVLLSAIGDENDL